MPTTTKMGIVYPSSTDLVKDGATAMGTISTTVDSKSGLILISTTSFSGVASQAITPVFSANFNVYKVFIYLTTASTADANIYIKLRSGATDASSNYQWAIPYALVGSAVTSFNATGQTTGFTIGRTDSGTSGYVNVSEITFFNPFAAQFTGGVLMLSDRDGTPTQGGGAGGFTHLTAASYDGFNIISSTGNISGVCTVFGVNNG